MRAHFYTNRVVAVDGTPVNPGEVIKRLVGVGLICERAKRLYIYMILHM